MEVRVDLIGRIRIPIIDDDYREFILACLGQMFLHRGAILCMYLIASLSNGYGQCLECWFVQPQESCEALSVPRLSHALNTILQILDELFGGPLSCVRTQHQYPR